MSKLPVRMKLAYGASDFGFSMAGTIIMIFLLFFVVQVLGLDPGLAALVIAVGKIWDAVIDPFIGHLSDRVRSRWGRRRPFLLWFAAPYGATFTFIWLLPRFQSQALLAVVFGLLNMLFITFFSLLAVPYNTLCPDMTRDYDERTSLNSYRMAFSIIGGLVASAVPNMIVGGYGKFSPQGYALMGLAFGLAITAFPFFAFFGTREMAEELPAATPSLWSGIRAAAGNRPFLLSLIAFLANWVSFDMLTAVLLFFTTFCLRLDESAITAVMASLFISAALCLPLWVWISGRIGKKSAYILGLGFLAFNLVGYIFLPPGGHWLVYAGIAAVTGIAVSAAHVIPYSIIPDAIEYDELQTGENHEGVYFGLVTFLQQAASAGGIAAVGMFLKCFGFVQQAEVQSAQAQLGIRLALGIVPSVLILIGITAIAFYPITRAEHARIVDALSQRRTSGPGLVR